MNARPSPPLPSWLDATLFPFEPRRFSTPDGAIAYVDVGRGRPVLVAHGTPSWSFEWRAVIAALAVTHRVVVPDHLGFGLSDRTGDSTRLTPRAHAQRLAALVRALDLEDVVLVAHDFGGPIGLGALFEERRRFSALVLANTWMWSLDDRPDVRRMSSFVSSPFGKWLYRGLNGSPRFLVPAGFGDRRLLTRAVHRHYLAPFPDWASRLAPWQLGVELAGSSSFYDELWARRAELAELPTAIVWGGSDPFFRAPELARLSEAFPLASVRTLEHVGHFVAEEAPAELVGAVIETSSVP